MAMAPACYVVCMPEVIKGQIVWRSSLRIVTNGILIWTDDETRLSPEGAAYRAKVKLRKIRLKAGIIYPNGNKGE